MRTDGRASNDCQSIWGEGLPYGLLKRCERVFKHSGPHKTYHLVSGAEDLSWTGKPIKEELVYLKDLLAAEHTDVR